MSSKAVLIGACLAVLAVALGAFGAHALRALLLDNGGLDIYTTASQYHFLHALGLILIGTLVNTDAIAPERADCVRDSKKNQRVIWLDRATWCMSLGTIIFSASLYMLAITGITWLGAVTPIGGTLLILAWVFVVMSSK